MRKSRILKYCISYNIGMTKGTKAKKTMDIIERDIYSLISSGDGIKAKEIAHQLHIDRKTVNHYLYSSPYMHDLCYQDQEYQWHGLIGQSFPHRGLGDYCGYYGLVGEFLELDEEEWFELLLKGCQQIGRNLNDTRGLFHSFRDSYQVMRRLFADISEVREKILDVKKVLQFENWEIAFELRIKKSKMIRIYADVLVITGKYAFSLEFKMNDKIEEKDVSQAGKYSEYQEVLFGPWYDVIPVLVLTKVEDLYRYVAFRGTTAEIPVVSGDMLFNVFDEYLQFLDS